MTGRCGSANLNEGYAPEIHFLPSVYYLVLARIWRGDPDKGRCGGSATQALIWSGALGNLPATLLQSLVSSFFFASRASPSCMSRQTPKSTVLHPLQSAAVVFIVYLYVIPPPKKVISSRKRGLGNGKEIGQEGGLSYFLPP